MTIHDFFRQLFDSHQQYEIGLTLVVLFAVFGGTIAYIWKAFTNGYQYLSRVMKSAMESTRELEHRSAIKVTRKVCACCSLIICRCREIESAHETALLAQGIYVRRPV